MRRDKVLDYIEAFFEVRQNRVFDNLAYRTLQRLLRLSHQTPHTAELTDLLTRTAGTRVHHHVNRIEALILFFKTTHEGFRDLVVDARPDVDNLVVTLVVGNQTHLVVLSNGFHVILRLQNQGILLFRNLDVAQTHRQTTFVSRLEAQRLDVVEELRGAGHAGPLEHHRNDLLELFLGQQLIHETYLGWYELIEQHAAGHRLDDLSYEVIVLVANLCAHLNIGVLGQLAFIEGNYHFLVGVEDAAFTLDLLVVGAALAFGHIVKTQNHVLRRYRNRCAVGGVQDVVRRQHEHGGFQDSGRPQGNVHCHLVTVKVSVEGRTNEWVQLDSLALNEARLERLDA